MGGAYTQDYIRDYYVIQVDTRSLDYRSCEKLPEHSRLAARFAATPESGAQEAKTTEDLGSQVQGLVFEV